MRGYISRGILMSNEREILKETYRQRFITMFAKELSEGTLQEKYQVLAGLIRDQISSKWLAHRKANLANDPKAVYYFSIEYLPGRFLINNLIYLGIKDTVAQGLAELGIKLEELAAQEEDPGLGNGGLGRLASAFLDSLASLEMPGYGMGIRYGYGLFEQKIVDGKQAELPDNWLENPNPWEYRREEEAVTVKFGGSVTVTFHAGRTNFLQENYTEVKAVPYDIPILGYRNPMVNVLRLWKAEAVCQGWDFAAFNRGEYLRALEDKAAAEAVTQVLYPDDSTDEGKKLRLKQEYFFVSAGLQSIIRQFRARHGKLDNLPEKVALHINDTHPAMVIPELMRILIDEEEMGWDRAWSITSRTVSYTNHTILPEALERWPEGLFKQLLPRIHMLVEEINRRLCAAVTQKYPGNQEILQTIAIIAEGQVRMGNLSVVGSYSVNGVSAIHTEILKSQAMHTFYTCYPEKFNNKTNGVTQRRWFLVANPGLAGLITEAIGDKWLMEPGKLQSLVPLASDQVFLQKLAANKLQNKERLASFIRDNSGILVDPHSIFDVQVKRIHAYKRQLLNALHIMSLYNRLRNDHTFTMQPRTFIFGGKAAPAYFLAKKVISLINALGDIINNDPAVRDKIKVIFLENYNVSLAELIMPAAEVSEQLSTAGKEASGTGNMKFMMNGAITIGTLDGANLEIRDAVGEDNFFTFGLTAEEVMNFYHYGGYSAWAMYYNDPRIAEVCEQLKDGFFPDPDEFRFIYEYLLHYNDEYFVLRDFPSYAECQQRLNTAYQDRYLWLRMSALNIAHSGIFSSDRTIREYAADIWKIRPLDN